MIRFMLDTDIAIYLIAGDERVVSTFERFAPGDVAISALAHTQMLQGAARREGRRVLRREVEVFAGIVGVLPYDRAASDIYGDIVDAIGFHRGRAYDRMIAAHAISLGATLVTNNSADFADVPELELANWAA